MVHVETAHEKRVAKQVAQKKKAVAQKKRVQEVDRAVADVTKTVFGASSKSSVKPGKSSHPAPVALVSADVSKVTTEALADVTSTVLTPRTSLELPTVTLPDLNVAVSLPAVDLTVVKLPSVRVGVVAPAVDLVVDLPVVVEGPTLSPAAPPAAAAPHVSRPGSVSPASTTGSLPQAAGSITLDRAAAISGQPTRTATPGAEQGDGHGYVTPTLEIGLSLVATAGTGDSGLGLGAAPTGSAGGSAGGALIFGLAVSAGLAGLKALHARPAHARSGHTLGLLRQPGFSPD
ncbi:hypothetical protein [Microlunatus antarcticus]|uniref:Uncharacterized protein n=1 Tax=Microlunatus antarcticus TaxID=53388 RepID=A0A7W5JX97_9ACTN|nr:hypothetical protein [Microlunatus antarcticus]MBB3327776.1 hypothetical protein [Microlunatus antarcticus]